MCPKGEPPPQALGEPRAASACDSRTSFQNRRSRKIISTPRWLAQGLHSGKDTARGCQGDARKKKAIRSGERRKGKGPLPPVRMEAKRQELCSASRRGRCRKKGAPGASPPCKQGNRLGGHLEPAGADPITGPWITAQRSLLAPRCLLPPGPPWQADGESPGAQSAAPYLQTGIMLTLSSSPGWSADERKEGTVSPCKLYTTTQMLGNVIITWASICNAYFKGE